MSDFEQWLVDSGIASQERMDQEQTDVRVLDELKREQAELSPEWKS